MHACVYVRSSLWYKVARNGERREGVGGGRRMEKDGEGVKEKERDTHTKEKKE